MITIADNNDKRWKSLLQGCFGAGYFVLLYFGMIIGTDFMNHLMMGYTLLLFFITIKPTPRNLKILGWSLFLCGVAFLISLCRNYELRQPMYKEIFYILVAIVFLSKKLNVIPFYCAFFLISGLILYRYVSNFTVLFLASETEAFFATQSANYISVLLLSILCVIFYQLRIQGKKVPIVLPLITFFISMLSLSRSGMISSAVLLIGILFCNYKLSPKKVLKYLFFSAIIVFAFIVCFSLISEYAGFDVFSSDFILGKFQYRSSSYKTDARNLVLTEYLSNLNLESFLFGYDWEKNFDIIIVGDTHNSYLQMHHSFGFIAFFILYRMAKSALFLWRNDKVLFVMMFSICLRAFTDDMFFINSSDFAILLYLFIPYYVVYANARSIHQHNIINVCSMNNM